MSESFALHAVRAVPSDLTRSFKDMRDEVMGLKAIPLPDGGTFSLSENRAQLSTVRSIKALGNMPCVYVQCLAHEKCSAQWQILRAHKTGVKEHFDKDITDE